MNAVTTGARMSGRFFSRLLYILLFKYAIIIYIELLAPFIHSNSSSYIVMIAHTNLLNARVIIDDIKQATANGQAADGERQVHSAAADGR